MKDVFWLGAVAGTRFCTHLVPHHVSHPKFPHLSSSSVHVSIIGKPRCELKCPYVSTCSLGLLLATCCFLDIALALPLASHYF